MIEFSTGAIRRNNDYLCEFLFNQKQICIFYLISTQLHRLFMKLKLNIIAIYELIGSRINPLFGHVFNILTN